MSSDAQRRADLLDAVVGATRQMAGQGIRFSQAVADRHGLALTDVEALEQLATLGRATAGQMAELTGLTSGAATRMIDRLEQSGFIRRAADPADRRRVILEPIVDRIDEVAAQYAALRRATRSAIERYTDDQLQLISDYLERSLSVSRSETASLGAAPGGAAGDSSSTAPLGGTASGRLVFVSGAPSVTLRADSSLGSLYRAQFRGAIPKVRVREGTVTVRYGRRSWFEWRAQIAGQLIEASAHWRDDRADIALNSHLPWVIELRGGVSRLVGDLAALELAGVEAAGGVSKVDLNLPAPWMVVPIRVSGGANDLALHRPAGTALRLRIRGGANKVSVDGQQVHGKGDVVFEGDGPSNQPGEVSFETTGFAAATNRYEIELTGGANRLTVDTR
jgi:DNA-binding MarR family transcriptional regulator